MADSVTTMPYNQERRKQQGKVTLFYTNVEYHQAHKGFPPPVIVKGQIVVKMPALGESIIMEDVYAKDVEFKTRYRGRSAFTRSENGGEAMATYIKEALAKGIDAKDIHAEMDKIKFTKTLSSVSDDDLVVALKERYPNVPDELLELLKRDEETAKSTAAPQKAVESLISDEEIAELKVDPGRVPSALRQSPKPTRRK